MPQHNPFRLLVCGGRNFWGRRDMNRALDTIAALSGPLHVIEGGANGADAIAHEWAAAHAHLPHCCAGHTQVRADWGRYGRKAGRLRNQQMLEHCRPDAVLAAPGGTGTADMVRRAKAAGVPVYDLNLQPI